ncbi:hypothetical protein J1605_010751 [Eschrichtius robustus]|uniref:Uncharacterized protein n=1 Tax=Eschrichtius robustus TaxID=9764 RepID=A0AB34GRF4_ESCRO|nr:hypothetical protein J1605_010751 [Eschrichtius robustus]
MKPDAFHYLRPGKVLAFRSGFPSCHYRSTAPSDTPPLLKPLARYQISRPHPSPRRSLIGQSATAFGRADIPASHHWPKSTSLCGALPKVSQVQLPLRGGAVPSEPVIGCDREPGRRARLVAERGLVGAAISQREQTSPLSIWQLPEKNSREFPADEPVAVLTACSRDWKHRGRQPYLQKTPLPPSFS